MKTKITIEEVKILAKEIIGNQIEKEGYTSGNFELEGHRIAWDLHIEAWKE